MHNFFTRYKSFIGKAVFGLIIIILVLTIIIFLHKDGNDEQQNIDMKALSKVEFNVSNYQIDKSIPKDFIPIIVGVPKEDETEDEFLVGKAAKKLIDFDAEYPFEIKVNRSENFVVVYGIDKDGNYTIPYKTFICSTAKIPENTPIGIFSISDKYRWHLMVDGTYAQYAIRIDGQIMLHSVPYYSPENDDLETEEYNKLGKPASLGCVRMKVAAIKWIYENCKEGTAVSIYELTDEEPPIPIPKLKKLDPDDERSGWDPTDPLKGNPWKK